MIENVENSKMVMLGPKVALVIVTYNSENFINACIDSVLNQNYKNLRILVIDNGSQDRTLNLLDRYCINSKITLLKNSNEGFSKSNNTVLEIKEQIDYIFFLNPDTKLEDNFFQAVLPHLTSNIGKNFILLPQLKSFSDGFISCGVGMDIFGFPYGYESINEIRNVFYADGAGFIIPYKTFRKLGGFDADYFMFQEDVDLSWRAHLYSIPLIPIPDAIIYHWSGGSTEGGAIKNNKLTSSAFRRYNGERNILSNLIKNYSLSTLVWVLPLNLLLNFAEFVLFLILMKPSISLCYVRGYYWNIANLRKLLYKRKIVQENRVVSDKDVMRRMEWRSSKIDIFLKIGIPRFKS